MKLFIISFISSLFLLGSSVDTYHSVKKRVLDKAISKHLNVKDYSLKVIEDIKENEGIFYCIQSLYASQGYLYIGKVESCRIGGCTAVGYEESEIDLMSEYFNYFIILDENLNVRNVKIYDYNATYGYEICSPLWLRNFNGLNSDKSLILGENIDAISGATISSQALVDDLIAKVTIITSHINNYSFSQ